jgi:rare lipoprotein A
VRRAAAAALALAALSAACAGPRRDAKPDDRAGAEEERGGPAPPEIRGPARSEAGAQQEGIASWYGKRFHGRRTASGERYDMQAMTCAHRTHAFGTRLRVTDLATGRSVVVRVNDRGPFAKDRVVDLSAAAARRLGIAERGVARVRVEVVDAAAAPQPVADRG